MIQNAFLSLRLPLVVSGPRYILIHHYHFNNNNGITKLLVVVHIYNFLNILN